MSLTERNAFARWNALIHGLTVLMQGGMKYHEAAMQSGLMGYKSRGHGKNKPFTMSYFSNTSRRKGTTNKFNSGNVTSAREIARRTKQATDLGYKNAARYMNSGEFTPQAEAATISYYEGKINHV